MLIRSRCSVRGVSYSSSSVFSKQLSTKWSPVQGRWLSSSTFTRTDIEIPVPITRGHLAAQLWQGKESTSTATTTPILCLHGYQDSSSSFDPLIPLILKDNMTIVSLDLPGHGLSSHLSGAGFDVLLDGLGSIHRVMRHFNWEKVTLLGHSYGSITSFVFSAIHPEVVDRYIAIDVFYPIPHDLTWYLKLTFPPIFAIEEKLRDPSKLQRSYSFEDMVQRTVKAQQGSVTEDSARILLRRGARPDPEKPGFFLFSHDIKTGIPSIFGRTGHAELLELTKNIKCPICLIKGEPGGDYEPRKNFNKMVDLLKKQNGRVSYHSVPGTHHLHLNEPHKVAPIISEFLSKKFS